MLLSKPETSAVAAHLCNSITRCHVCGGALIYSNRGRKCKPMYYCSERIHRGVGVCSNQAAVPVDGLDYAIGVKLADMLNKDFDRVLDLCEQQAQVWRERQAMPKDQRTQLEREAKRLEGAINRLLDQVEAGQAIGTRLKERQEQLDIVKAKLELADAPEFDRQEFAASLQPYGPLVGLGVGDPVTIRSILKKCGIDRIIVTPDGPDAWRFEGQADFSGTLHRRTCGGGRRGPLRCSSAGFGRRRPPASRRRRSAER